SPRSGLAPPAVECDRVTVRFITDRLSVTALKDVSLTLPEGTFVTLVGPSGCGKSTLLRVIADLIQPTTGRVGVLGRSAAQARRERAIGFVFQDAALLPWRTALQNVELPHEVGGRRDRGADARSPEELLDLVGLAGWEKAYPHEL